ncbi:DUF2240 domain-containing protein [Haloferax sp. Atlit-19N]|uniref:DUF2240 family protein n=1 Tax=Haloferax sp. Atlit-19N TaxID=2077201 RepID=UPI000E23F3BA|nr:DUF2240 family protein [Haloferax sp. Atlit-19N]RDZ47997.1 DUF2240 domain-containing protein [Haloferax sp. Atlit-19N]
MSLDVTVAVPFRQHGSTRLGEGEFVVALSLDRDWFSPDQAKRLIDLAAGRGLVERDDGEVVATFNPAEVRIPEEFEPDASVLREQSAFEQILDACVAAGIEKQAAVAGINERQSRLGVTAEAAAVLFARANEVNVDDAAEKAKRSLAE